MSNEWGSENFSTDKGTTLHEGRKIVGLDFTHINDFHNAVAALPVSAKKAFYAAASARSIKRRTWNGCAFNQGGTEIGLGNKVQSVEAAAKAFNCSVAVVQRFIKCWDTLSGSDDEVTGILREKLEEIGLFTEPGHKVRIVSYSVWRDEQNQLVRDFQKELESTDFVVEGMGEAAELLFAGVGGE